MSRLPIVGGDAGDWGAILNDFLSVAHNPDGTLSEAALAGKADDVSVVHTSGSESISGTKTFNAPPRVPSPQSADDAAPKSYVDSGLDAKADDAAVVHLAGAETIGGEKNFTSSPIIPPPSGGSAAAPKSYVDAAVDAGVASVDVPAHAPAVARYDSVSSSYPARAAITADTARTVIWIGPVAPPIGGTGAVNDVDVWWMTP